MTRIVLDCRWLGLGGAGRVTELLLRELQASPPPGEWVLWGEPDRLAPFDFPGAAVNAGRGGRCASAASATSCGFRGGTSRSTSTKSVPWGPGAR